MMLNRSYFIISLLFLCCHDSVKGLLNMDNSLLEAISEMNQTLRQTVTDLRYTNDRLSQTISEMDAEKEQSDIKIAKLEQEIQHLRTTGGKSQVLFYAVLRNDRKLGPYQAVEFDHVITNVGNAYDPQNGHFTAPVAGYYHFAAVIMSVPGTTLFVNVVKNGGVVAHLYGANSDYDSGVASINIALAPNDTVWLRHESRSYQIANGNFSSFSGFLISEIS